MHSYTVLQSAGCVQCRCALRSQAWQLYGLSTCAFAVAWLPGPWWCHRSPLQLLQLPGSQVVSFLVHPLHCVCSLETAQSRLYIGPASKQRCLSACLMHTSPLCVHAGWPASAFDTLNVVCCTIYEAMLCCQHDVASQQNLLAAVPPFMAALLSNRAAQHAEPACFQQYCWRTTSGGGASAQCCVAKTCVPVIYCTVILGQCWRCSVVDMLHVLCCVMP
jgi:hypothetical protein